MSFDREKAEDIFDNFLIIMDDQIDSLIDDAGKHEIHLDMSPRDLEKLEPLFDLMSTNSTTNELDGLIVYFARYLGELVRSNYGGKWILPMDEDNVNFNEPVIAEHCPFEGVEFAPISTMRAYSIRRKKGTLRNALEADIHPELVELADLIEPVNNSFNNDSTFT